MADSLPQTLAEWEARLAPQVGSAQLRLLGEIAISVEERDLLGRLIGSLHKYRSKPSALNALRRQYPCAFITFLVAQGVYGYSAGNYWDGVAIATSINLTTIDSSKWGLAFEEILEEFGLHQFPGMEGSRYVSIILAHGGIPSYSLDDFFSNLLQPAVARPQYADLGREELITELLQRSSADFADKPVRRFLKYGGRVSVNFLWRCREMAQEFLETGLVPDSGELGLPQRVVDAYRAWIANQEHIERRVYRSDDLRLRKPEIALDPWGQGVTLRLPSQLVPATLSQSSFAWRLKTASDENTTIPVKVRRMGFDLRTFEPQPKRLQQPAKWYELEFLVDQKLRRTWRIDGISPERPLLVFDSSRATLVNWMHEIPAERLWLLYPAEYNASCEGEAEFVDLPSGYGAWAEYKRQEWSLTRARRLFLRPTTGGALTFPIQHGEASLRPTLADGHLLSVQQPTRRTPLYVGQPPHVLIPLTGKHSVEEELSVWRMTIRSRGTAVPEISQTFQLDQLPRHLDQEAEPAYVKIPLLNSGLLSDMSYGSYNLRLRGPLGRDAELPFRIWHQLEIEPLQAVYVPNSPFGHGPVEVNLHIAAAERVELPPDEGSLVNVVASDGETMRLITIQAYATSTVLNLTLARPAEDGLWVRVPVQIPIPRLHWLLADEASDGEVPPWSGALLSESLDALLQMRQPTISISLPTLDNSQVRLQLRLKDSSGTTLSELPWNRGATQQREWRFSLIAFFETLRHSSAPFMRFELFCLGLPGHAGVIGLPILSITKALHVEAVSLEDLVQGGKPHLCLRWHEPNQPLRHRHVRIWPAWQPWRKPLERDIPDDALGEFVFPVSTSDLPVGRLRLQFSIEDPWMTVKPPGSLPQPGPGLIDVVLLSPERRIQQIASDTEGRPHQFLANLERAYISFEINDGQTAHGSANWCFENLDLATPQQTLALGHLLTDLGDNKTYQALRLKLFAPRPVDRLLIAYERGEVDQATYDEYLNILPPWGQLPIESCLTLLTIDREAVQLAAIQRLIENRNPAGPKAVLERLSQSKLSEADAVALLSTQGDFALAQLQTQPGNEQVIRLLELLAPKLGETVVIVVAGLWIRTSAGWGQIEKIEDAKTGRIAPRFIHTDRRHKLWVTLRPTYDSEPILVDLSEGEIRFLKTDRVFTCAKCRHFSARDQQSVVGKHEQAAHWSNPAEAYSGIGGAVATEPEPSLMLTERKLSFSFRAPANQWV